VVSGVEVESLFFGLAEMPLVGGFWRILEVILVMIFNGQEITEMCSRSI